jgi:hypothetical protein
MGANESNLMTDDDNKQHEILQKFTPGQKLRLASDLYFSAWALKKAALKHQHPDWSDEQLDSAVREIFSRASN